MISNERMVCVCACAHMCGYIFMCLHVCTCMCMYVCMCVHAYAGTHVVQIKSLEICRVTGSWEYSNMDAYSFWKSALQTSERVAGTLALHRPCVPAMFRTNLKKNSKTFKGKNLNHQCLISHAKDFNKKHLQSWFVERQMHQKIF